MQGYGVLDDGAKRQLDKMASVRGKKLKTGEFPEGFKVFCDSNELLPHHDGMHVEFEQLEVPWESGPLSSGDYTLSFEGELLTKHVILERKGGVSDFLGCCGQRRKQFEATLAEMAESALPLIIFETSFQALIQGTKYAKGIHANQVSAALVAWTARYNVMPIFAASREHAVFLTRAFLSRVAIDLVSAQ